MIGRNGLVKTHINAVSLRIDLQYELERREDGRAGKQCSGDDSRAASIGIRSKPSSTGPANKSEQTNTIDRETERDPFRSIGVSEGGGAEGKE